MNEVSIPLPAGEASVATGDAEAAAASKRYRVSRNAMLIAAALAVPAAAELLAYRLHELQEILFIGYFLPVALAARLLSFRKALAVTALCGAIYLLALWPHMAVHHMGDNGYVEAGARVAMILAVGSVLAYFVRTVAREKERALAAEHERAERLKIMVDVSRTVTSSLRIDQVLQVLSVRIVQALNASFCTVALLDDDALRVVAIHPVRDMEWSSYIGKALPLAELPDFEKAIRSMDLVVIGGRREDICEAMPAPERALMHGAKSMLLFPLVVSGEARGVICIGEQRSWERSPMDEERTDLCRAIVNQAAVAVGHAFTHEAVEDAFLGTIRSLAEAIDAKDPSTRGHSDWVSKYSLMIGRTLGLGEEELESLKYAGYLHDIGKIGIPDGVLGKPAQLSPEEWRLMKKHPIVSSKILEPVRLSGKIKEAVRHHHERFDGKGYPYGLSGDAIPLESRILAVADAFEAMTSDRPYRKALSDEQAVAELVRCSGSQFDPQIIEIFLRSLGRGSSSEEFTAENGMRQAG